MEDCADCDNGFELTDGLRSLTRTKSKADEELRRTLEEAERRRQNPTAAKLPSEKEAADVLEKARKAALAAVDDGSALRGRALKRNLVEHAIRLSHEKYCSATAMLAKTAQVTKDFEIEEG